MRDDCGGWGAAVAEGCFEAFEGEVDVGLFEAERFDGEADLLVEETDFVFVEVHVSVRW